MDNHFVLQEESLADLRNRYLIETLDNVRFDLNVNCGKYLTRNMFLIWVIYTQNFNCLFYIAFWSDLNIYSFLAIIFTLLIAMIFLNFKIESAADLCVLLMPFSVRKIFLNFIR
jgi:hypothetical protein